MNVKIQDNIFKSEMQSSYDSNWRSYPQVELPVFPAQYGNWVAKSIGGVDVSVI